MRVCRNRFQVRMQEGFSENVKTGFLHQGCALLRGFCKCIVRNGLLCEEKTVCANLSLVSKPLVSI